MRRWRESMLPSGMDGGKNSGSSGGLPDWQRNVTDTLARSIDRPSNETMPKLRTGGYNSIRPVTPEPRREEDDGAMRPPGSARQAGPEHPSVSDSPSSATAADRRNGLVFQDSYSTESLDGSRSGPPVSLHAFQASRPRTRTLEEQRSTTTLPPKSRHRSGHSTTSASFQDVEASLDTPNALGLSSPALRSQPQPQESNSIKGRRLVRKASRSASPLPSMSDVPSIDSLPYPVSGDANKILMLMKTLCGRMRGEVEYQNVEYGPWYAGVCYIDDVKGSLMYEGDEEGSFHATVVSDLRGARIRPVTLKERSVKCLEISNHATGLELRFLPTVAEEFDLWLAALLCWQQIRTGAFLNSPKAPTMGERRPSVQSISSRISTHQVGALKEASIIKVGKILLWDRGIPSSPASIVRRPLTRDLRASPSRSWRRVSCILKDNGEFKFLMDNDVTYLSVIQLSQLSRAAIQRLDKSVLDEEFCIAIYPQYTSTSTQLSIFRPVYIALESRVLFEVWFCLLRAFSIPEIYGPQYSTGSDDDVSEPPTNDMFRIEKTLTVRVVEAKIRKPLSKTDSLQSGRHAVKSDQDPSIGDYFAEVILDGEVRSRTMTKHETRRPFWREDCEFQDLPSYLPRLSIMLKKILQSDVSTHGFLSSTSGQASDRPTEVVCGIVEIPVDRLERGKDTEAWYPILDDEKESIGELFLKVRHDELVVLLATDYQSISELLHRFTNGLTMQIAQAVPTNLRKLSEILTNIFQVSGHVGEWLMTLVEDEIDGVEKEVPVPRVRYSRRIGSNESSVSEREKAVRDMSKSLHGEANLLFRGNSLLTQALDFHMRRLGKEYLEDVLSEQVHKINTLNPDCEVDPSRLSHGDDINKNWAQLISLTTDIWECMAESAKKCPPELRQILKYIRAVAEDRYGNFLRTVAYTSVSGFLFLRFFCPALLNPKLFGLLNDHPQPNAQRSLTLIAKSLQALANLSTFGQKEEWMEPMNKFISGHRQAVREFIDDVCSLPGERNIFALPASYSTPITILARLPPISREGFPSLPYLIDHARNLSALVKLWLDSVASRDETEKLKGELLEFHEHCIALKDRTDECLLKAETERAIEPTSWEWEDVVASLEASKVEDDAPETVQSPPWSEYIASISAEPAAEPRVSTSDSRSATPKQSFWEHNFGRDSKYQRPYEVRDPQLASPSSRSQSKNGKGFLSNLIRKGTGDNKKDEHSLGVKDVSSGAKSSGEKKL